MKILYVKNNSERAKEFQLKTIIYEKNGKKFVKKQALTKEAIPHLKKMKNTYLIFSQSILNPNIKLVPIIDETPDSLTFEFIQGVSLEKKILHALNLNNTNLVKTLILDYFNILHQTFNTSQFNEKDAENKIFKTLFSNLDFSELSNTTCFNGLSNIDLIFSNIIYKDENIYLIDYEWVYPINIPIDYIAYRPISMLPEAYATSLLEEYKLNKFIYGKMERMFVDNYVMRDGFYLHKSNYTKKNTLITTHVTQLQSHIQNLQNDLKSVNDDLFYARSIIDLRDKQLESMTLKNRFKRAIMHLFPTSKIPSTDNVNSTYKYSQPIFLESIKNELKMFSVQPLISIIMPTYNVDNKWLDLAIKSVECQWYENWELCIADDASTNKSTIEYLRSLNNPKIKIKFLEKNGNISVASNSALSFATGSYIALLDNDDEITPDALYNIVKVINTHNADFIYSDEDFISTEGVHTNPHFKPDFSPDLLLSHNYITHLTCFKKTLLDKVGKFNSKFDGSQDYDLFLRLTEQASSIYHVSKVLYHWRTLESSTSINSEVKPEALHRGRQVVEEAMQRRNIHAEILHTNIHHYFRTKYAITGKPLVSIIIPFKDKPELLKTCINSIINKSTYTQYEIIAVSNNSIEKETFSTIEQLQRKDPRVTFHEYNEPFNYARLNNHAVKTYAKGEHILLLNNDIEVITPDWIESMLEYSQRSSIGCVGAKLYYPNDTIQHAGIIIGLGGYAGHSHKTLPKDDPGYFNRLSVVQNVSAVTAACLMVKKSIYLEVNGMDDINFKIAYNDVDFCLRVREHQYLNIFTPFAELYHHESLSRGYENTPEKLARFQVEKDALSAKHTHILTHGDPYYNPNLTHDKEDFSLCLK